MSFNNINSVFKFNSKISEPLTIYTQEGCGACIKVKQMCDDNGIKFNAYNRRDHEEKVLKESNGYNYVPVIFDSHGKFIGGMPELEKLIND